MAQEKGTVVNFKNLLDDNGNRVTWDSHNGMMYAWEVEIRMGGEITLMKAFTKIPNKFSVDINTEIYFETDWSTKYGLPYAKRIKDVNSKYANGNNNQQPQGNSQPQTRQSQQVKQPITIKPPIDKETTIKIASLKATMLYLIKISKDKALKLNASSIKQVSDAFKEWINSKPNHNIAIEALFIAINTKDLNKSLEENNLDIKSTKDVRPWFDIYYEYIDNSVI